MQIEIPSFSDFENRTNALAAHLGITLDGLPPVLDMSRDMLFGYRKGRYPITRKAAVKLNNAEREAGIGTALVKSESDGSVLEELRTAKPEIQFGSGSV